MAVHCRLSVRKKAEKKKKKNMDSCMIDWFTSMHVVQCKWTLTVIHMQHFCHFLHRRIDLGLGVLELVPEIVQHSESGEHKINRSARLVHWAGRLTQLVRPIPYWSVWTPFSACLSNRWSHPIVRLGPVACAVAPTHSRRENDATDCPTPMCHSVLDCPANFLAWNIWCRCVVTLCPQLSSIDSMRCRRCSQLNYYFPNDLVDCCCCGCCW